MSNKNRAEVKLDPVDNQRLARVCGVLDENLRQIESALDVTIARRGGKFTVRGEHAERAAQALEHFYDGQTFFRARFVGFGGFSRSSRTRAVSRFDSTIRSALSTTSRAAGKIVRITNDVRSRRS